MKSPTNTEASAGELFPVSILTLTELKSLYSNLGTLIPIGQGKNPIGNNWQNAADFHESMFTSGRYGLRPHQGIVIIDIDAQKTDASGKIIKQSGFQTITDLGLDFPTTLTQQTPSGGEHRWYRVPNDVTLGNHSPWLGIDIRAANKGQCLVYPTDGYSWLDLAIDEGESPSLDDVAYLPDALLAQLMTKAKPIAPTDTAPQGAIFEGGRNNALTAQAGMMRKQGLGYEALLNGLMALNQSLCIPPLLDNEVIGIAKSVAKYKAGNELDALAHGQQLANVLLAKSANSAKSKTGKSLQQFVNNANSANCENQFDMTLDSVDTLVATPKPTKDQLDNMLFGDVGRFAKAASNGTGINPIGVALATLSWLSSNVSPRIVTPIGDTFHPARLFAVHVGRSARGGKGDSMNLLNRVRWRIAEIYPDLLGQFHSGALTTPEGVATLAHDGWEKGDNSEPPITDKRIFAVEPEFQMVLEKAKRTGNPLLPALRDLWDYGGSIKPVTKTGALWSTEPHIAIFGNVTPFELRTKLETSQVYGGTLNRFLLIFAERLDDPPNPVRTDDFIVNATADMFAGVIQWAKGSYGSADYNKNQDGKIITLDNEAEKVWVSAYPYLSAPYGNEMTAAATDRRKAYAKRIALLFAIIDKSDVITSDHIKAGIAWAQFSAVSTKFILNDADETPVIDIGKTQKLIEFLKQCENQQASRRQVSSDCFKGHMSKKELDATIIALLDKGKIERFNEEPKAGGTKVTVYKLAQ